MAFAPRRKEKEVDYDCWAKGAAVCADHKASAIRDITTLAQRHSVLSRKATDRLLL